MKLFNFILLLMMVPFFGISQTTVTIGSGAITGATNSNAGPIYRSSAASGFDFSNQCFLYTASDLSAVGIYPGASISQLAWNKTTTFGTVTTGNMATWRIYMDNTTTAPSASWSSSSFATQTAGDDLVHEGNPQDIPATAGWYTIDLSTPFVYDGGSLEICASWDCSLTSGNPTTGAFQWLQDAISNRCFGGSNSSSAVTMGLQTNRPQIQITYAGGQQASPPDCPTLLTPLNNSVDQPKNVLFEWMAASTGDPATSYNWMWGTSPTTLTNIGTLSGTTGKVNNINFNTTYYWAINPTNSGGTTDCTVNTFNTTTVSPPTVPTGVSCTSPEISNVIFSAEFDNQNSWTGTFTGDGNWNFGASTPSAGTGANAPFSGTAFMYYEASGNATSTASAVSPSIDLSAYAGENVELSFFMHGVGLGQGTFEVAVGTSPGGPFTTAWTWTGNIQNAQPDAWYQAGVDLSSYAGQIIYLELKHTGINDFRGDMSIDLLEIKSCTPQNDNCIGAVNLNGNGPGTPTIQPIPSSTIGSTASVEANLCAGVADDDVWFTFTSDSDGGEAIINLTNVQGNFNPIASLYSGSCGSLNHVTCSTPQGAGNNVNFVIPSLSANTVYYVRVYDEGTGNSFIDRNSGSRNAGTFSIALEGSALPISFVKIEANSGESGNYINWSTSAEYNSDIYMIERSKDGKDWKMIDKVKSENKSTGANYSYFDLDPYNHTFYRIASQDFDGKIEYSNVVSVQSNSIQKLFFISPNPTNGLLNISLNAISNIGELKFVIYDEVGKIVNESLLKQDANGNILYDISQLRAGVYNISIVTANNNYSQRIVKI